MYSHYIIQKKVDHKWIYLTQSACTPMPIQCQHADCTMKIYLFSKMVQLCSIMQFDTLYLEIFSGCRLKIPHVYATLGVAWTSWTQKRKGLHPIKTISPARSTAPVCCHIPVTRAWQTFIFLVILVAFSSNFPTVEPSEESQGNLRVKWRIANVYIIDVI